MSLFIALSGANLPAVPEAVTEITIKNIYTVPYVNLLAGRKVLNDSLGDRGFDITSYGDELYAGVETHFFRLTPSRRMMEIREPVVSITIDPGYESAARLDTGERIYSFRFIDIHDVQEIQAIIAGLRI